MNITLFYRYYLKRLFKSGFFGVYLLFVLFAVVGFEYILYKTRSSQVLTDYGVKNYKDWFQFSTGLKSMPTKYGGGSTVSRSQGIFSYFGPAFVKFFSLKNATPGKDFAVAVGKLTCASLTGILITSLFVSPTVSFLVSRSENNGDDETALTLTSPIKRDDLVIGKFLAFLTLFLITILLTFTLPFFGYYIWLAESFSWSFGLTFLFGSLIFALAIFCLFYAVLFYLDTLPVFVKGISSFLLSFIPYIGLAISHNAFSEKQLENIDKFGSNFGIIVPLSLVIGGLFLFLGRERFRKKDF